MIQGIPPNGAPWRGVNLLLDPRKIGDDELVLAQNAVPARPRILGQRGAITFGGYINAALPTAGYPVAAEVVPFNGVAFGVAAFRNVGSGYTTKLSTFARNVSPATTDLNVVTDKKPSFAFMDQSVFVAPGHPFNAGAVMVAIGAANGFPAFATNPFYAGASGGTTASAMNTPATDGYFAPQVVAAYNDRLVYGNFGPGLEGQILFSDSFSKSTFTGTSVPKIPLTVGLSDAGAFARALLIGGSRDGDRIVAMKEIMLTAVGTVPQKALLILKEYSTWLLTGEPNQTTDDTSKLPPLGDVKIARVAFNCGCASPETVVTTPYGTIWAGPDDVWMFQYGQIPLRIGSKIRPALLRTPASMRYRWHAAYHNGFYRLAIDSAGAGVTDDSPCGDQFWLDLREGPPQGQADVEIQSNAQWWGPQQFAFMTDTAGDYQQGTRNMFTETRANEPPALYGVEPGIASNTNFNNIVVYDAPNARDSSSAQLDSPTPVYASLDVASLIIPKIETKEFDGGDPMVDKILNALEVNMWVSIDKILKADFIMDGGATVDTQAIGVTQYGFASDVDGFGSAITHQTQARVINANPNTRDIGKTFRIRLYPSSAYDVVVDANDTFLFVTQDPTDHLFVNAVKVAPGAYTLSGYLTALVAAMNTASPGASFSYTIALANLSIKTNTSGYRWYPVFQGTALVPPVTIGTATGAAAISSTYTAAQYRSSRKVGALIDFDTSTDGTSMNAITIASKGSTYLNSSAIWEFASMSIVAGVLKRRPT